MKQVVNSRPIKIGASSCCCHGSRIAEQKGMVYCPVRKRDIYEVVGHVDIYEQIQSAYDDSTLSAQLKRIQAGLQDLPSYDSGLFFDANQYMRARSMSEAASERFSSLPEEVRSGFVDYGAWAEAYLNGSLKEKLNKEEVIECE